MEWAKVWKATVQIREQYETLWHVAYSKEKSWFGRTRYTYPELERKEAMERMEKLSKEHEKWLGVPWDNKGWGFGFDISIENLAKFVRKVMSYNK